MIRQLESRSGRFRYGCGMDFEADQGTVSYIHMRALAVRGFKRREAASIRANGTKAG